MSPALTVEISRAAGDWPEGAEAPIRRAAVAAWAALAAEGPAELSVALGDDAMVQVLNRQYRGKDRPTNVLSFPADDPGAAGRPRLLGDVVLALETVAREADERSRPFDSHVSHLVVHGVLHLMGHDHETETQAVAMEALESGILAGLGIDDPYRVVEEPAN
jgi:probable rRNA maturation factor